MASKRKPERIVAGAPVKHALQPIRVELLQPGVWLETFENGREVVVCDLTSALWRAR